MYIDSVLYLEDLDRTTIYDCSHAGRCDDDVAFHRQRLNFTVNRDRAIRCLEEYGAWNREELNGMSDTEIAEIILWIACVDFREYLQAFEDGYLPENTPYGSDLFTLE